uniref:Zinc knuckle CX2CX4HX4C domain-containing protein n=1 Tax=Cannabis sativa TaxID=3483 RepID=A0A803QQV3_CANSA
MTLKQKSTLSELPEEPEEDVGEEPSAFLAVKLLTNRHFNEVAFKKWLHQMWPEHYSINVLVKEPNFFTVEFGCFVTVEMLTSTPFWIEVFGIPFLDRSRALARKLEIDVTQPLHRGACFHFANMATPVWLEFRYKNLPDFCHYCGSLSHIVNHCAEFVAKYDSSSVPPSLRYDHTLGAKVHITSNPLYIATTPATLRPKIFHPHLLDTHQLVCVPKGQSTPTHAYNAPLQIMVFNTSVKLVWFQ